MCLAPATLLMFLQLLDPKIVEITDSDTITIHSTEGPVNWSYIEQVQLFAIDGNIGYCVPDKEA
jgi:hypothetical protein